MLRSKRYSGKLRFLYIIVDFFLGCSVVQQISCDSLTNGIKLFQNLFIAFLFQSTRYIVTADDTCYKQPLDPNSMQSPCVQGLYTLRDTSMCGIILLIFWTFSLWEIDTLVSLSAIFQRETTSVTAHFFSRLRGPYRKERNGRPTQDL